MGSSKIYLGQNGFYNPPTTLTANTGEIISNSGTMVFNGGSLTTWNKLTFTNAINGGVTLQGSFTCDSLTIASSSDVVMTVTLSGNITANYIRFRGKTNRYRTVIKSSVTGTTRTITPTVLEHWRVDYIDITGAGDYSSPAVEMQIGNGQGTSGITFDTPRTLYWVATSGGNSYDSTSWATTSGGTTKVAIPLPQDSVIFDANSITSGSRTITLSQFNCKGFNSENLANNPTIDFSNSNVWIHGNFKLGSSQTISGTPSVTFRGRTATQQFNSAGKNICLFCL